MKNWWKSKTKIFSKLTILLIQNNLYGILPSIAKVVLYGNKSVLLRDSLNRLKDNKMKEKDAMNIILQVSKGVQELHNHRITHRDLKP